MKLRDFFEGQYRPLKLRGRSPNTVRLYLCTISALEKFLQRPATLEELFDDLLLARYLTHRAETRSPFTSEKERTQIMAMIRFAHERRACGNLPMPCVPPTPLPERVPEAWPVESIRELMKAAEKTTEPDFWKALISVCWETAERIGAITSLKPSDYMNGSLLVRAEYRKGRKRDKIYRLSPATSLLVEKVIKGKRPGEEIFAWKNKRTNLWYAFGKIVKSAGLGEGRRTKFHMLRRSAATHYASRGGDATALLDHSSPRVTRAYLDPRFIDAGPQPCEVLPAIS